ncbi:MAG: hypothetical protein JNK76_08585 [Planctomycetales bacterium]|nr:hypothetical protein [Planctomycetales bacterium]
MYEWMESLSGFEQRCAEAVFLSQIGNDSSLTLTDFPAVTPVRAELSEALPILWDLSIAAFPKGDMRSIILSSQRESRRRDVRGPRAVLKSFFVLPSVEKYGNSMFKNVFQKSQMTAKCLPLQGKTDINVSVISECVARVVSTAAMEIYTQAADVDGKIFALCDICFQGHCPVRTSQNGNQLVVEYL